MSLLQKILLGAVPVVFAITVHEVAHGWVANRLGDPTARLRGRLTLNPLRHIDLIGTVLLPIILLSISNFVFGWAKPVPVDWRNLRRPRRDMALVAVAGPCANIGMLILWTLFARLVVAAGAGPDAAPALFFMAEVGIVINVVLIVLNLLPLPPLDGSRVVSALLPPHLAYNYNRLERWGLLILIVLMFTGVLGRILEPPLAALLRLVDAFLAAG
ncbi:MAG: site-2 protease family protein [Gammaproteobacteria bacterium]|nr:site-2 protease family protein [Gammaproteobacteria bacterium]